MEKAARERMGERGKMGSEGGGGSVDESNKRKVVPTNYSRLPLNFHFTHSLAHFILLHRLLSPFVHLLYRSQVQPSARHRLTRTRHPNVTASQRRKPFDQAKMKEENSSFQIIVKIGQKKKALLTRFYYYAYSDIFILVSYTCL